MSQLAMREAVSSRTLNTSEIPDAVDHLESATNLAPLFVHARDALAVADLGTGRISHWNRAAERLFGYSAAEAVGRAAEMLMPPAVARLHRERVAHFRKTGDDEILTGRGPLSIPALDKHGEELRVELSVQLLPPADAVLLTFRDARCQQQAELNGLEAARATSALSHAEARLHRCEQLLRESASELQRPLDRVRRAAARLARLASRPDANPLRIAQMANVVEARTNELRQRLEQIVDIAAMDAGTFELQLERVNLVPLLSRIVAQSRARSTLHRVNLATPQGLTAQIDARRIEAVVQDLIERAARRNPRGCWIDIDLRRPLGGIARIEVRDYGRRLSDRERQRLVVRSGGDRGWQVNRGVIERHGGTVSVDLPRDAGARVVLVLPTHHARTSAQSSAAGGPA